MADIKPRLAASFSQPQRHSHSHTASRRGAGTAPPGGERAQRGHGGARARQRGRAASPAEPGRAGMGGGGGGESLLTLPPPQRCSAGEGNRRSGVRAVPNVPTQTHIDTHTHLPEVKYPPHTHTHTPAVKTRKRKGKRGLSRPPASQRCRALRSPPSPSGRGANGRSAGIAPQAAAAPRARSEPRGASGEPPGPVGSPPGPEGPPGPVGSPPVLRRALPVPPAPPSAASPRSAEGAPRGAVSSGRPPSGSAVSPSFSANSVLRSRSAGT